MRVGLCVKYCIYVKLLEFFDSKETLPSLTACRGRGFESVWPIIVIRRETTCSCKQTHEKRDQHFWQAMKSVGKMIITINPIVILLAFHNHMCKLINQNMFFLLFSQKCWFCHYHVPYLWQYAFLCLLPPGYFILI